MASLVKIEATKERPFLDANRRRLLDRFYNATLRDLMLEIHDIVEESSGEVDGMSIPLNSVKKTFEDDRKVGDMLDLLQSISRDVIEALLWNTLALEYRSRPGFEGLLYKLNNTAGVYVNIFAIKGRQGKGLTRMEWEGLIKNLECYLHGSGKEITATSSADLRESAALAEKVDNSYGERDGCNQQAGQRFWMNAGKSTYIFVAKMKDRLRKDLDDDRNTPQEQSLMEVGCANNLAQRILAHDQWSGLTGTASPWGLVLSCLKYMRIPVDEISVPILKTWKSSQFEKAEALITFLTGSLVCDGGCNPKQPGTNHGRPGAYQYMSEQTEVFIDHDWLKTNVRETNQALEERIEMIEWNAKCIEYADPNVVAKLDSPASKIKFASEQTEASQIQELISRTTRLRDALDDEDLQNRVVLREIQTENKELVANLETITQATADAQLPITFHNNLRAWLGLKETSKLSISFDGELEEADESKSSQAPGTSMNLDKSQDGGPSGADQP